MNSIDRPRVAFLLVAVVSPGAGANALAHPIGETSPLFLGEYGKIHAALASDRVDGVATAAARIESTAAEMIEHASQKDRDLYGKLARTRELRSALPPYRQTDSGEGRGR